MMQAAAGRLALRLRVPAALHGFPASDKLRGGVRMIPLSRRPGGVQAYKLIIPSRRAAPEPQTHDGYEWLYVLDGQLRRPNGPGELPHARN